ncbi:MAG TPA: hypothetical protein VLA66_09660 [Thermoanaerobaculia bacterium]|nr:hypothetical protein [Thermoanaerobaculia bacterium]
MTPPATTAGPAVQASLFGVDTPAHAYATLHAEEAADFNDWLE